MADILQIMLPNGTIYNIKDNNALPLTGGHVSGSATIDDLSVGNLIVTGDAIFVQGIAGYLPLSGGVMTGPITVKGGQSSAYNDQGLLFTNGSRIGENTTGGLGIYAAEKLYLRPSSGGSSSGDGVEITSAGLYPSNNNSETLGDSSHKWSNVYATTFTGALSGNATTATKFASAQSITLTGDITGSASSQAGWSIATTLTNSGVTANTYGNTSQQTPTYGDTFNIPYFTVDAKGRLTSAGTTTVKIPASDNTDTKVSQSASTTASWRKVLLHYTADAASTTAVSSSTNVVYAAVGVSVQPSTGTLRTTAYNVADHVTMQYNSTTQALDFIFS